MSGGHTETIFLVERLLGMHSMWDECDGTILCVQVVDMARDKVLNPFGRIRSFSVEEP